MKAWHHDWYVLMYEKVHKARTAVRSPPRHQHCCLPVDMKVRVYNSDHAASTACVDQPVQPDHALLVCRPELLIVVLMRLTVILWHCCVSCLPGQSKTMLCMTLQGWTVLNSDGLQTSMLFSGLPNPHVRHFCACSL